MIKDQINRAVFMLGEVGSTFTTPLELSRQLGCSKQYVSRILSDCANKGLIDRVRVQYKAGHRDMYVHSEQLEPFLVYLKWTKNEAPVAIQNNGLWYLAQDWSK